MTIETKFDVGQDVYFMLQDKILRAEVTSIRITVDNQALYSQTQTLVQYEVKTGVGNHPWFGPDKIFGTPEELAEHLVDQAKRQP